MSASVIDFPRSRKLEKFPNDARMEWLFIALDGHENAVKKRLIVLGASAEVGFLSDQQATALISALGLEAP